MKFVREHMNVEQQTVGALIGINTAVHMLWHAPGLQVRLICDSYAVV